MTDNMRGRDSDRRERGREKDTESNKTQKQSSLHWSHCPQTVRTIVRELSGELIEKRLKRNR